MKTINEERQKISDKRSTFLMLSIIAVLSLALAIVAILKEQHLGRIESQLLEEKQSVAQQAYQRIRKDFESTFKELHQRARRIAENEEVVNALQRFTSNADPASEKRLVQQFSEYSVDEKSALELYTVAPRLVAWNGFSMPLGEAPLSSQFTYNVQYEALDDREVWNALVAWHPVYFGDEVIGATRAMRLVGVKMPVENQYLESYSLADSWRRLTQIPVRVWFNEEVELSATLAENTGIMHPLKDPLGITVGSVYIPFPSQEELEIRISNQYVDIQTFLLTLLMFSLIVGLLSGLPNVVGKNEKVSEARLWRRGLPYFFLLSLSWWGLRYAMLYLDAPARWQRGKAPLAPLFDPIHFASDFAGGLFRSVGDTFITGIFVLLFAIWLFRLIQRFSDVWRAQEMSEHAAIHPVSAWVRSSFGVIVTILVSLATIHALGTVIYKAVLDSKLDYVERSGIIPDRLVFFMFCTLMIIGIASIIIQIAFTWFSVSQVRLFVKRPKVLNALWGSIIVLNVLAVWWYQVKLVNAYHVPFVIVSVISIVVWVGCIFISRYPARLTEWIHFRAALLGILLLAVPLYALLAVGVDAQKRQIMEDAASSFTSRQDPRVVFAIGEVLSDAGANDDLAVAIVEGKDRSQVSDLMERLLRLSPLSSLITHDVSIAVLIRQMCD